MAPHAPFKRPDPEPGSAAGVATAVAVLLGIFGFALFQVWHLAALRIDGQTTVAEVTHVGRHRRDGHEVHYRFRAEPGGPWFTGDATLGTAAMPRARDNREVDVVYRRSNPGHNRAASKAARGQLWLWSFGAVLFWRRCDAAVCYLWDRFLFGR